MPSPANHHPRSGRGPRQERGADRGAVRADSGRARPALGPRGLRAARSQAEPRLRSNTSLA